MSVEALAKTEDFRLGAGSSARFVPEPANWRLPRPNSRVRLRFCGCTRAGAV